MDIATIKAPSGAIDAARDALALQVFQNVCDMEEPLTRLRHLLRSILNSVHEDVVPDDRDRCAMGELIRYADAELGEIMDVRSLLFDLSHPDQAVIAEKKRGQRHD